MSRVAKNPIPVPEGISVNIVEQLLSIKSGKVTIEYHLHELVTVVHEASLIRVEPNNCTAQADAIAGSTRALLCNMLVGITKGFERKLELLGVGYRAQVQGKKLNLTLGFSHPITYDIPDGILIETPSQTEILIKGIDKQKVGKVASEIRRFRPPEPYKGKGVRYSDERIELKETKKK